MSSQEEEARESETQQQQQQRSLSNPDDKESRKPVVYDAKNIRVHFGGRWKRPSTVGIYTVDEYVDGRYLDILDVEGELINMLDLAEGVVTREPRLNGCTFVFYWLDNGDRVSIENESELLSMWANSSPDVHNNIHLFAETHIPFTTTLEASLPNSLQAQPISTPSFAQHELPNSLPTQQQSSTPQQSPLQLESTTTKTSSKVKVKRTPKTKPSEERLLTDEGTGREKQSIPKTVATKKRVQQEATETTSSGSKRQKKHTVTRACREAATEFGSPREERAARRVAIREKQHTNHSPVRSEDQVELPEEVDNVDMLEEGMVWSTMHECRRYLRNYAIANKFVITFQKNEASRIRAKCVEGCPWVCNIKRISPDGQACRLKKLNNVHTCSPNSESKNKMADARWVARLIEEDENLQLESCKPKDIIDEVLKRFSVKISYSTAWAATSKKKAYEKKSRACSVCQQTGHSKMTCKNPMKEGSSRANRRRATPRRAESAAVAGQGQPQESPQSAAAAGQGLKEIPHTAPAAAGQQNPKRRSQSAAAATGQKQIPSTAAPTEGPQCFTPTDPGGEGGQTNCPEWPLEPEMNTSTWNSTSAKSTILQGDNEAGEANVYRTEPEEEHHGGQSSDNEHEGGDNLNVEFTMFDGFTASTDNPYGQDLVQREQHQDIGVGKLEEGMVWYTMFECRRYLRNYAIANKFVITFQKNEASRIRAKCVKGCPWVCNIRRLCPDGQACRLKKLNNVHTCSPNSESKNKMADARWVAKLIEEDEKLQHESCKPKDIVDEVLKRFSVKISYSTAWSAKLKALNKIESRRMDGEVPSKKKPRTCSVCLQTGHSKRTCKSPINEGFSRRNRKKATPRRAKRSAAAGQGQLQERLQNAAATAGQGQLQERTHVASTTAVQGHPLERPQSAALAVGPNQMPLATSLAVWPQYLTATNSADRAGQTVYPMWLQGPVMNTRSDWTSIGGTSPVTEQFMRQFDNVTPSESTSKATTNLPTTLESTRGYNAIGETNGMNQHWLQYREH